jgi:hypothetical protein
MKKIFQASFLNLLCITSIFAMDKDLDQIKCSSLDDALIKVKEHTIANDPHKDLSILELFTACKQDEKIVTEAIDMLTQFAANQDKFIKDKDFVPSFSDKIKKITAIIYDLKAKKEYFLPTGPSLTLHSRIGLPYEQFTKWLQDFNLLDQTATKLLWCQKYINDNPNCDYGKAEKAYAKYLQNLIEIQ